MAMLIQLRYRIKAIETIKKITHAMRLISMSSRSRLKSKEEAMRLFLQQSQGLLGAVHENAPFWSHPFMHTSAQSSIPLIILIGSTRGLCGSFNTTLFNYFDRTIQSMGYTNSALISVGKKATSFANDNYPSHLIAEYLEINSQNIAVISQDIIMKYLQPTSPYTTVIVFSNVLKTFFVQKPQHEIIIPFKMSGEALLSNEYYWFQEPEEILNALLYQVIDVQLQYLIFQSLLAEHAARFISMDNATRNAQQLLEDTTLQYNKLRQAKITKELTELVSSLE